MFVDLPFARITSSGFSLHADPAFPAISVNDGNDYNVIKNFKGIKIVGWIAIYNISPDIVSE